MTAGSQTWAEFASAERLLHAADTLRQEGIRAVDGFTPYALPELEAALELRRPWYIPWLALAAAGAGGGLAFIVIWWTAAYDYPLNVGGRPLNSLPADIPIVFESSILAAVVTTFAAMLVFSGMPRLHHRLEVVPDFARASVDRYWLGFAGGGDAQLSHSLRRLGALSVREVGSDT